ncbi:MAG: hypothetical protein IE931_02245 [Sphingobacteriales bacterium]|nr:hypothetical protein [Sphingobacteriales bacterium]
MEAILIHPENAEQAETVKAVLKALKVQFETQPNEDLSDFVLSGIQRGLEDVKSGRTKTFEEVKRMLSNK